MSFSDSSVNGSVVLSGSAGGQSRYLVLAGTATIANGGTTVVVAAAANIVQTNDIVLCQIVSGATADFSKTAVGVIAAGPPSSLTLTIANATTAAMVVYYQIYRQV